MDSCYNCTDLSLPLHSLLKSVGLKITNPPQSGWIKPTTTCLLSVYIQGMSRVDKITQCKHNFQDDDERRC